MSMPLDELRDICKKIIDYKPVPPCSKCGSYQQVFSSDTTPVHLLNKPIAITILQLINKNKENNDHTRIY